MITMY